MLSPMPTIIKAVPENAHLLREIVAGWPELAATIDSLRQQDVFPGLRCMTVTLDDAADSTCTSSSGENPGVENGGQS